METALKESSKRVPASKESCPRLKDSVAPRRTRSGASPGISGAAAAVTGIEGISPIERNQ